MEGLLFRHAWTTHRADLAIRSHPRRAGPDLLPAHPIITGPVAVAASGRSRGPVYDALEQLLEAGILLPLSTSRRNRSWEAAGLLRLLEALEAGR